MKLTIDQVSSLLAAHRALDGYDRVVKDGSTEKVVKEFYKYGFGLRMLIASNIDELEKTAKKFDAVRTALLLKHSGGSMQIDPNESAEKKAAALAFAKEMQEAVYLLHEVDLDMIDPAELKGDENTYPPSVLAGLMPVLKRAKKTSAEAKAAA